MTDSRRKWLITLSIAFIPMCLGVVILIAVATTFIGRTEQPLFSDPRAPRPRAKTEWRALVNPHEDFPPYDSTRFDDIETSRSASGISYTASMHPEASPGYNVTYADESHSAVFAGGSLDLIFYGLTDFHQPPDSERMIPINYFDFDGQQLSTTTLKQYYGPDKFNPIRVYYSPQIVKFGLKIVNLDSPQILDVNFYDAATFYQINYGSYLGITGDFMHAGGGFYDYNPTPMLLVIDLATGPAITHDIDLQNPQPLIYEPHGLEVRLIDSFDHNIQNLLVSDKKNSHGQPMYQLDYTFSNTPNRTESIILLGFTPDMIDPALDFTVAYKNGDRHDARYQHDFLLLHRITTGYKLSEIDHLELQYRPNYHRVIFRLNTLPGSEAMFQDVENLFDVKIKTITFENAHELTLFIAGMLQMDFQQSIDFNFPQNYFPKTFTNVTVDDIFNEYKKHLPAGWELRIDSKDLAIITHKKDSFQRYIKNKF